MLYGIDVAVTTVEVAAGKNVKKDIGGLPGKGNCVGSGHIWATNRLIFFLAEISSSLVDRSRIDIYSAKIR